MYINFQFKGESLENQRLRWKNITWIIIDEISMLSYESLRMIHLRLTQLKNNNKIFGGVNIVLMGDLLQLNPINGNCIYNKNKIFTLETDYWKLFKMYHLNINQRQKEDKVYGDLCSRIRIGKQTAQDLNILNKRYNYYLNNKSQFKDALHLCSRKITAENINKELFDELIKDSSKKVYSVAAEDSYANGTKAGKTANTKHVYQQEEKCGGIIKEIKLAIGCRVMLRRNTDVAIGLVNGSIGTVTGFEWNIGRDQMVANEIPKAVLIKFDDASIVKNYFDTIGDSIRIKPISVTFQGKYNPLYDRL